MYLKLQLEELKSETFSSHYTESFYRSQFSCTRWVPGNPHHFQRLLMFSLLHLEQGHSRHPISRCTVLPVHALLDFLILRSHPNGFPIVPFLCMALTRKSQKP